MTNVNISKILKLKAHLLKGAPHLSFVKIASKISNSKKLEFVLVKKPKINQMLAVLFVRLRGNKFFWIQNFDNPPTPNFLAKLLMDQADLILVENRKEANKLKNYGISKTKIKLRN